MLTIKKILSEFGLFGLVRLPLIFISVVIHNIRLRTYRKDKNLLLKDIKTLKNYNSDQVTNLFNFFPHLEGPYNIGTLNWVKDNAHSSTFFGVSSDLLTIIAHETSPEADETIKSILLNNQNDGFYRSHALNKGKNDYWEYYLTPWHRLIHNFSYFLWDKRFQDHMFPIYQKYKNWYKEFIWFTFLGTGSNIYAVEAGKAFHCLNEFVVEGNKKALDRYVKHILKSKYFLKKSFDNGIPLEGGIYARFLLNTLIHLDQIHRTLNLSYEILDKEFIRQYANYLESSFTVDKGFETSGDSHIEIGRLEDYRVFVYLSRISRYPIFDTILQLYNVKDYHYKPFYYNP